MFELFEPHVGGKRTYYRWNVYQEGKYIGRASVYGSYSYARRYRRIAGLMHQDMSVGRIKKDTFTVITTV